MLDRLVLAAETALDHTAAKPPSPPPDAVPVGFAVRSALDWLVLTTETALDLTAAKPPSPPPVTMRCRPDSPLDPHLTTEGR
jgi:hypothetical protein